MIKYIANYEIKNKSPKKVLFFICVATFLCRPVNADSCVIWIFSLCLPLLKSSINHLRPQINKILLTIFPHGPSGSDVHAIPESL